MIKKIKVENYNCVCVANPESAAVVYMIYPEVEAFTLDWLQQQSDSLGVSIVMVYVPGKRWNDDLTPWPEAPEAEGFPPFAGNAASFNQILTEMVIPQAETACGLTNVSRRALVGVSLAGLFTLWQWLQNDTFNSIACLSGSFWYEGFLQWFENRPIPSKKGKAFFLLGTQEPKAKVKAYQTVGVNTEAVVERIKAAGITCQFDWVPGNHFSNPVPRAEKALSYLCS